ncbi:MAG: hypothetical protein GF346_04065 [Candidatus Eisenbacteria bacterium]|nr:hypothetical protein [Candidatus Latescibacterota bacterium]MBD3301601.1 hypothetical protein [Candidatus Eisenbacteria bacterium]
MNHDVKDPVAQIARAVAFAAALLASGGPGTTGAVGPDAPDPRYPRYEEVRARLEAWEREHPEIVRRETIGRTVRGAPILAVRISDHPDVDEPEPALLLHGAQHANEVNGTLAILEMGDRILERYGTDPRVTAFVDGLEIWCIPVVNVDGYRHVFSGAPGWMEWRKNLRDNDHDGRFDPARDGVDLNRNWDYRWSEYPRDDPTDRMYKGPSPFSEPETVALRDLILRETPLIVVDFHSPGSKTLPNMIFWPWHDRARGRDGPDAPHYRPITQEMARRIPTEADTVTMNGDWYSYDTLPKEQCWIYKTTGACALLAEISSGFWWEGAIVDSIAARVARGSFALLERALDGPGLTARVTDAETGLPLVAEVVVAEAHDSRIGPRRTDPRHGRYWRLLEPGTYRVTIRAAGRCPVSRTVDVGDAGWTRFDAALEAPRPERTTRRKR